MATSAPHTAAQMMTDLFKLLRTQWLSRPHIAEELGVNVETATRWAAELEANGMLLRKPATKWDTPGPAPMVYALAPEWGGQAC